jgi:hypothetical protein
MDQLSPLELVAIVIVALVILGGLAFALFFKRSRRHGGGRIRSELLDNPRVEVLETTVIDAERRLVLIRCDQIEHLVMIGGPSDVVVENDVRKVRPPVAPEKAASAPQGVQPAAPRAPLSAGMQSAPARVPPAAGAALDAAMAAAAPKRPEPVPVRPASDMRAETPLNQRRAPLPPPAAAPRPQPARNGEAPREAIRPPLRPLNDEAARAAARRAAPALPPSRPVEPPRTTAAALPSAQVPWNDPNSIENEIVQALRTEPPRGGDGGPRRVETATARNGIDSTATLGDLADRLEEALAREMQSVSTGRKSSAAGDVAANVAKGPEAERPSPRLPRPERREPVPRQGTANSAPQPPAESAREQPASNERREEAPVINLSARRREAADPLEDEMARLLGELTGDTKSR